MKVEKEIVELYKVIDEVQNTLLYILDSMKDLYKKINKIGSKKK